MMPRRWQRRAALCAAIILALAATSRHVAAQRVVEFRAGGLTWQSVRTSTVSGRVGRYTTTLRGGEGALRLGWLNLTGRVVSGDVEPDSGAAIAGALVLGEAIVGLGPRFFTFEGGYARRAWTGGLTTTLRSTFTGGLRVTLPVGNTGLDLRLRGWALRNAEQSDRVTITGYGGESVLLYYPHHVPLYLTFGYRAEQASVVSGTRTSPEGSSTLMAGVGLGLRH